MKVMLWKKTWLCTSLSLSAKRQTSLLVNTRASKDNLIYSFLIKIIILTFTGIRRD